MKPAPDQTILSADETTRMLHIHANTLRRWTAEGKIRRCPPFHRGEWRYRLKDVESVCRRQQGSSVLSAPAQGQNDPGDANLELACPNRLLAENAAPVIWVVNIERPQRLTYVSPSATLLLGYTPGELMDIEMKDAFTATSLGRLGRTMAEKMGELGKEGGHPDSSVLLHLEMMHKNGSVVPVEVEATHIPGLDGKPGEILAIAHEIDGQRQAPQPENCLITNEPRTLEQPAA